MNSSEARRLGEEAARRLAQTGQCDIEPGLTDAEFVRIERDYEFEFADDHRAFLAAGLPLNSPAPRRRRRALWVGGRSAPIMSSAWVEVTEQWGRQFGSLHNDFPVAIDGKVSEGEEEERTKEGWRKRWSVEPGTHTLRLGRGWLKSPEVSFTVVPYQTARFVARNRSVYNDFAVANWSRWYSGFFLVCSVFKHDLWITIRQVDLSIGL